MAVVMMQRADGGKALLGFTGLDALQAWDARARPVPVTLDKVAETAVGRGCGGGAGRRGRSGPSGSGG